MATGLTAWAWLREATPPTDPVAAERGTAVSWLLAAPHLCCH